MTKLGHRGSERYWEADAQKRRSPPHVTVWWSRTNAIRRDSWGFGSCGLSPRIIKIVSTSCSTLPETLCFVADEAVKWLYIFLECHLLQPSVDWIVGGAKNPFPHKNQIWKPLSSLWFATKTGSVLRQDAWQLTLTKLQKAIWEILFLSFSYGSKIMVEK